LENISEDEGNENQESSELNSEDTVETTNNITRDLNEHEKNYPDSSINLENDTNNQVNDQNERPRRITKIPEKFKDFELYLAYSFIAGKADPASERSC